MAIEELAEEVATNLEEAAEITRKLNTVGIGYLAAGLTIGVGIGFYFGYKFNREKIKAEAFENAEAEIDQMRKVYLQKALALGNQEKPEASDLVEDLGYAVHVPERERPLPAPVPGLVEPELVTDHDEQGEQNEDDLPMMPEGTSKSMHYGWNDEEEKLTRSPDEPYIIHQNEYNHTEARYEKVVYTYWALDDVVTDADNHPIPHGDLVIGQDNLRFGHGADDTEVVYVRNDRLERDIQVCRLYKSFEEEVLGLSNEDDDDDDDDND